MSGLIGRYRAQPVWVWGLQLLLVSSAVWSLVMWQIALYNDEWSEATYRMIWTGFSAWLVWRGHRIAK